MQLDVVEHQKSHTFCIQILLPTIFLIMLKIWYTLQIYNNKVVKTNQGNKIIT